MKNRFRHILFLAILSTPLSAWCQNAIDADSVRQIVIETVTEILNRRDAAQVQREQELNLEQKKHHPNTATTFPHESEFREPKFALRTNLLLPLMNIGFEIPLTNCLSLSADAYAPWLQRHWMNSLTSRNNVWCLQGSLGLVDVRYWPGPTHRRGEKNRKYRLRGHSIGGLFGGGFYDFEKPFTGTVTEGLIPVGQGWQGDGFVVGISYMYAQPLGKGGIHMEFEVAFGYVHTDYQEYYMYSEQDGRCFRINPAVSYNGFFPLKASVNVVVPLFGNKVYE